MRGRKSQESERDERGKLEIVIAVSFPVLPPNHATMTGRIHRTLMRFAIETMSLYVDVLNDTYVREIVAN